MRQAVHLSSLARVLVVPAEQVQQPVDAQEAQLGLLRFIELARLPKNHRPGDGEVSEVLLRAGKREDVGYRVVAREIAVQTSQLLIRRQADGDGRRPGRQSRLHLQHVRRPLEQLAQERRWDRHANRLENLHLQARSLNHRQQVNPLQSSRCEFS